MISSSLSAYGALAGAIVAEVIGTTFLQKSEQFTRPLPTTIMAACYLLAFYLMSLALRSLPIGVTYAIWSGLGIVLISAVGVVVFRQSLDLAGIIGIGFIVLGVAILNLFSKSVPH